MESKNSRITGIDIFKARKQNKSLDGVTLYGDFDEIMSNPWFGLYNQLVAYNLAIDQFSNA